MTLGKIYFLLPEFSTELAFWKFPRKKFLALKSPEKNYIRWNMPSLLLFGSALLIGLLHHIPILGLIHIINCGPYGTIEQ